MVTSNLLPTPIPNAKEISFLLNWINSSLSTSQPARWYHFYSFPELKNMLCWAAWLILQSVLPRAVALLGGRATDSTSNASLVCELSRGCWVIVTSKTPLLHTACWQLLLWHLIYSHYSGKQVSQDPAVSLLNPLSGLPRALAPQIQVLSCFVAWEQSKNLDQWVSAKMPQTTKKGRRTNKVGGIICTSNPY